MKYLTALGITALAAQLILFTVAMSGCASYSTGVDLEERVAALEQSQVVLEEDQAQNIAHQSNQDGLISLSSRRITVLEHDQVRQDQEHQQDIDMMSEALLRAFERSQEK